ncbi:MAG: hypothetical protein M3Y56_13685, partial [Armatimonadota bacterium]|nr:hypothetical protein [Armatimonadota bacterium]
SQRQLRTQINYNTALDIIQGTGLYALGMGAETLLTHFCEWLLSDMMENAIFAAVFHGIGYATGFATVCGLLFFIVSSIIKRNQVLLDNDGNEQEE